MYQTNGRGYHTKRRPCGQERGSKTNKKEIARTHLSSQSSKHPSPRKIKIIYPPLALNTYPSAPARSSAAQTSNKSNRPSSASHSCDSGASSASPCAFSEPAVPPCRCRRTMSASSAVTVCCPSRAGCHASAGSHRSGASAGSRSWVAGRSRP